MNIRFITIILSNIALVSAALSSGTTIPSSATVGGNTLTRKQSTNNPISDVITTMQVPSPSPTTPIIQNTTVASPTTTISNSPSVITPSVKNPKSIDSNTTKNPNPTTPSAVVNTKSKNSKQQPAGPGTTVRPGASTTTKTTVPDATTEEAIETTVPCDCSKYLPTSTDSTYKNTESTTTPTSSQTTVEPHTSEAPQTTVAPQKNLASQTNMAPQTNAAPHTNVAPQTTMIPQTTAAPLTSSTTNTPSKTTTNTMTKTITTKKTTTTSTTINSSIVIKTVPTTLPPTTMVSAITTVPITGASITSKPATPQLTTAPPTTPQPQTLQPKTSQSTTPTSTTASPTTPIPTTMTISTSEQSTKLIAITTSTNSTILQKPGTTASPSKAKRYRREVDMIQHDDGGLVDDDTNTYDKYCMDVCNITINKTTTVPVLSTTTERPTTTTPKPTTTTPRHRPIDLSGKLVDLTLIIVVKGNFTQDLTNHSSKDYTNLAKQYNSSLTEFYGHLIPTKFRKIVILDFSDGSIKCNYTLEMDAPINESDSNSTLQVLRDVNWKNASLTNLTLDVDKTATEQALHLSNDSVILPANVCVNNEVLEWDNNGDSICKYKCDISEYKGKCGNHGECSFTYGGAFRCICKEGYRGNLCKTPKPTTTTAKPIKPDAIALSKIDIIGIAGGIGGGLVLILLVALCCVYTKLNKAKKRDRFYGYMDNDKEFLHDENSRIENVPDLKNEYTNLGYQTEQNELQMQRFEPEGKNVEYEPGQRQGAYERDDKAYRQVEEPEGGNVLIYQPKHLNGPMERQSGASKFDEVEERSNPYRMMDTDTTYKIRRPTVNSDRNVPYN